MATRLTEPEKPVYFILDGEKRSNDPRYFAALQREQIEAAREQTREPQEKVAASEEGQHETLQGYQAMKGAELKAEAERRELDITGIKKKSELIELLEQDDERRRETVVTGAEVQRDAPSGDDEDGDEDE